MSGMWLQDVDSISSGNSRLLMIFIGIVAFSMLVQAVVVIVFAVGAAKTTKRLMEIIEEVRGKAMPVLHETHGLIRDTSPKIKIITENFVETSHIVRSKAQEFDATASDVNLKARAQVDRVDEMVSSVLNTTAEITSNLQKAIRVPVREFSGLMNGLKAGLDVLVGRARGFGSSKKPVPDDRDPGW
jgi:hypothetical protein